jgi:hypothetical protein
VRRGGLWAKKMGLSEVLLGTHWEPEGNILGTKKKGQKSSPPPQTSKKKIRAL